MAGQDLKNGEFCKDTKYPYMRKLQLIEGFHVYLENKKRS